MVISRDNDYAMYLYTCNRCRSCAVEPSPEHRAVCPAYAHFGYFAYSGGGKGYVGQGILEGKVKPSAQAAQVAMNCLMCGACAAACPPGFDINAFVRDLRDHLVGAGFYANDAHRKLVENLRRAGNPWGRGISRAELPAFTGEQELLVWRGCRERMRDEVMPAVAKVLDAAQVRWGVLPDEPCCGAPGLELGDRGWFEAQAERVIAAINGSGAGRVLFLCPHCAAAVGADYPLLVGDVEAEPVTLPALFAELVGDERIMLTGGPEQTVTYHDPCKLARWLEEVDSAREVLGAMEGVELVEMERSGEWGWCCGSGGVMAAVAPELAAFTARERIEEARETGAEVIVTGCSYCTEMLRGKSARRQKVTHLAGLMAERIK
ncbi:MAG TPA: (Fe-S)-binding protein [bacterium]|nr:(Fe-S)-binding protein [bacterium]